MVKGSRHKITNAATPIVAGDAYGKAEFLLRNQDAHASVFLGGERVTPVDGYELRPGESLSLSLESGEILYGIVTIATELRVDVLQARERP